MVTVREPYQRGMDLVVVNYRTPADLGAFLESWEKFQPSWPCDVWIANVAPLSKDLDVGRWWTDVGCTKHHLIHDENVGYARACNHAANFGSRQVIAFFNADVVLTAGALDECYEHLLSNDRYGVLGPRQVDSIPRGKLTGTGHFGTHRSPVHRGFHGPDRNNRHSDVRDDAISVSGSAYFVRREMWDELFECPTFQQIAPDAEGAFLPTPHYWEETWCSYHAWAHGWKVVYLGTTTIVHKWHQASPIGGIGEKAIPVSQRMFREACDAHSIPHD